LRAGSSASDGGYLRFTQSRALLNRLEDVIAMHPDLLQPVAGVAHLG
jgi:hypothetical protein